MGKILLAAADLVYDLTDSRGWISAFKGLPLPQRPRRALQILSGVLSLAHSTSRLMLKLLASLLLRRKYFQKFRPTDDVARVEGTLPQQFDHNCSAITLSNPVFFILLGLVFILPVLPDEFVSQQLQPPFVFTTLIKTASSSSSPYLGVSS